MKATHHHPIDIISSFIHFNTDHIAAPLTEEIERFDESELVVPKIL